MNCTMCGEPSITKEDNLEYIICSTCLRQLSNATKEQLEEAYQMAMDKGLDLKAKVFKNFMRKWKGTYNVQ